MIEDGESPTFQGGPTAAPEPVEVDQRKSSKGDPWEGGDTCAGPGHQSHMTPVR